MDTAHVCRCFARSTRPHFSQFRAPGQLTATALSFLVLFPSTKKYIQPTHERDDTMYVQLGTTETFEAIFSQASVVGDYKQFQVCSAPSFGHFIVRPDNSVVTLAGLVVYTATPQEAGQLIDQLLVTKIKPSRPARTPATSKQNTTSGKRQKATFAGKRKTSTR